MGSFLAERVEQRTPSVEDGKLLRSSVSAMNEFILCPRKFHWKKVSHLPDKPPGRGVRLGMEGHARLEYFHKANQDVLGPLEKMGVARGYVPLPAEGILAEQGFEFMEGDIKIIGYIDLLVPREDDLLLIDWKYRADLDRFAADAEDLINPETPEGVQMLGYIKAAKLMGLVKKDKVTVRHVTFQHTGRKDVAMAEATIPVEEGIRRWNGIVASVLPKMAEAAAIKDSLKVFGNENACDKYGGCAFKDRCFDPMEQFTKALVGFGTSSSSNDVLTDRESNMAAGILSRILGTKTAVPKVDRVEVGQAPVAVTPEALAKIDAGLALNATGTAPAPVSTLPPAAAAPLPLVLPPDAPKSDPALAARVEAPVVAAEEAKPKRKRRTKAEMAEANAPIVPVAVAPDINLQPAAMLFVQDGVVERKAAAQAQLQSRVEAPPANVVSKADVAQPAQQAESGQQDTGIHLYIGCSPMGIATKSLLPYVNELDKELLERLKLKIPDIRAVATQELGYGKWKPWLAEIVTKKLPPPGHYVATTGDDRIDIVVSTLQGMVPAVHVITGGR